jgi:hypothetical protein
MLTTPPEKTGSTPTPEFPRVYGILMDWPIDEETATVYATARDRVKFYLLTFEGVRVVDTDLASLLDDRGQYVEFFNLGQAGRPAGRGAVSRDQSSSASTRWGCSRTGPGRNRTAFDFV